MNKAKISVHCKYYINCIFIVNPLVLDKMDVVVKNSFLEIIGASFDVKKKVK